MMKRIVTIIVLFTIPFNLFSQSLKNLQIKDFQYCVGAIDDDLVDVQNREFNSLSKTTSLERFLPEENKKGVIWLKAEFDLPEYLYNENLGIILGKIVMADEAYLNGAFIGRSGSMKPIIFKDWNSYRYYRFYNKYVKRTDNVLYVKIFGHEELSLKGKVVIGKVEYLDKLHRRYDLVTKKINFYVAIILMFYCIFPLVNYLQDKRRKESLSLVLISLSYTIFSTNYFSSLLFDTSNPPFGYMVQQKITFISLNFVLFFLYTTVSLFLGKKFNKWLSGSIVLIYSLAYLFAPTYRSIQLLRISVYPVMLIMFAYIIVTVVKEVLKKNTEAILFSFSLFPAFIIIMYDVFYSMSAILGWDVPPIISFDGGPIYLASYIGAIFLISFGIIVTTRYTKNVRIIEDMNKSLEAQIKKRTKQLSQQKDKLFNMNRKMIDELNLAKKIQQHLMPENDPTDYISSFYLPMNHVGGDLYEYVKFEDGRIGIFISDVSGHGVPSAFITLMIKTVLLDIGNILDDPSEVMNKINHVLYKNTVGHFITALYGIYNPVKRSFKYSCAGHYPPIILKKDEIDYLSVLNTYPLALMKQKKMEKFGKSFANNIIDLEKGSKLLLFTDGFIDAKSKDDENMLFQYGGMETVLNKCLKYNSKKFVKEVHSSLRDFTGNQSFDDDVCFICLDVL